MQNLYIGIYLLNKREPLKACQVLAEVVSSTSHSTRKVLYFLPDDLHVLKEMPWQQQCLRKRFSLEMLPCLSWFYCQPSSVGTIACVIEGGWDANTCLTQVMSFLPQFTIIQRLNTQVVNCWEENPWAVIQKEWLGFLTLPASQWWAEPECGRSTLDFLGYLCLSNCLITIHRVVGRDL